MFYYKGELTYEECLSLKKGGYVLPLYKCNKRLECTQFRTRKGTRRCCPGRLLEEPNEECGWDLFDSGNGSNRVIISVNEPEKYIPKHVIPIL